MIRPLCFAILLGASCIVLAEPLYKWIEPDGSITFSKNPPPVGMEYEKVDASRPVNKAKTEAAKAAAKVAAQVSARATAKASRAPAAARVQATLPQPEQATESRQRIAPQISSQSALLPGIQRASTPPINAIRSQSKQNNATQNINAGTESAETDNRSSTAFAASARKQRQCEDLKKRVISLEGRLRTRLTPADMDNTVVHMARYQRSYDQHCVQ